VARLRQLSHITPNSRVRGATPKLAEILLEAASRSNRNHEGLVSQLTE